MAATPLEVMKTVPLFEELDPGELQLLADVMHEANVPAGATVTAEGGPGDGFFIIDSGEAKVTVAGQPLATLTAGDYFGEIALLMGSERTATVTATTDLHCYALTPWDFRMLVEGNPSIALKVLQSMAARLETEYEAPHADDKAANAEGPAAVCRRCGAAFASAQQVAGLQVLLPQLGFDYAIPPGNGRPAGNYQDTCPACRRAQVALAQSARVGGFG